MPFEVFDKRSVPTTDQPWMTIQKGGTLSLNRAAFEALGSPEAVQLLFDREEQIIGFKVADPESPIAYPVRQTSPKKQSKNSNWVVAGTAFTKHYGIDASSARRFRSKMENEILMVDLKQEHADATGPRARRWGANND